MILLTGTTESLQVVLDAAPATNQLPCTASYADQGGSAGDNSVLTNGVTAVTIVSAPAAGVSRVINSVQIPNADTATRIVTVNKVVSGTPYRVAKITLPTGYQLSYGGGHWYVIDANGNFVETVTVSGGTLTANQGTSAALSGAWPVNVTDGTNVLGTSTHALRIDPTGTTTQPVSGTVTANQGGSNWSINLSQVSGTSIATPTAYGTAPSSGNVMAVNANVTNTVSDNLSQVGGSAISLGQKSSASSIPVVIASDQSSVKQTGIAISVDGVNISTTTSSTFSNSSVTKITSISVALFNSTISGGSVSVLIYDGSNTLRVSLLVPVPSSAVSPFVICDFQNLMLPLTNSGSLPYAKLSSNLTSGSIYLAISTG